MNDAVNTTPAPITYGTAEVNTPNYDALHAAAVAAGVITADQTPVRLALANGRWQVTF